MMYADADIRIGERWGQPDVDKSWQGGRGVKNYLIFADILYGWPLTWCWLRWYSCKSAN